jgi:predicted GIY-YIG superfamily endonuclease
MEHCTLITTDINRRVETHKGKGAKYTKTRLPVVLMGHLNPQIASKEEYRIKQLKRVEKNKVNKKK